MWLTNSLANVRVDEVNTSEAKRSVSVRGSDLLADETISVNVSTPALRAGVASVEQLAFQLSEAGEFEMELVHTPDPLSEGLGYDGPDRVIEYVTIRHEGEIAEPSVDFKETIVEFRVDTAEVDDPDNVRLYRYDGNDWVDMEAELVEESSTAYRFSADTPGFSQFVITEWVDDPAEEDAVADCALFGLDFGSFIVCWYWWVLLIVLILGGSLVVWSRNSDGD